MSNNNSNYENFMADIMTPFREKYPEGRVAINVSPNGNCILARARIYPSYKDEDKNYLAEVTVAHTLSDKVTYEEVFDTVQIHAVQAALSCSGISLKSPKQEEKTAANPTEYSIEEPVETKEKSLEERYKEALQMPCPIKQYAGKTLGHVLKVDAGAIKWLCEKAGDEKIKEAAKVICEYSVQATA